jgi:hypothetical protein
MARENAAKIKVEHARHVSFCASDKYLAIGTSSIYADDNYDFGLVLVDAANGSVVRTFEGSFMAAEIDEAARRIASCSTPRDLCHLAGRVSDEFLGADILSEQCEPQAPDRQEESWWAV